MQFGNFKFLSVLTVYLHLLRGVTSDRELLSCSFETSCGLEHTSNSEFDWVSSTGATPARYTGPSNDHTFGNRYGGYIYASSSQNYYDFGEKSILRSPVYRLTTGRGRIEFYYHMYDGFRLDDMGSLQIYACDSNQPLWTRRGNQGNQWQSSDLADFTCQTPFRMYIEATRGKYQSDIAMDDLVITDVFADATTLQATTEVPTTEATSPPTTTAPTSPPTNPPTIPPTNPPTNPLTAAAPVVPPAVLPTTRATKPIPSTKQAVSTGAWTKSPQTPNVAIAPNSTDAAKLTATMDIPIKTKVPTLANPTNSSNIGVSGDPNLQSGSSSPVWVGPIVVVCVAVLLLGLTLCLAVKRKKRPPKPASKAAKDVKYSVENPSYCGVVDSLPAANTNTSKREKYSYQELLQQQSYSSIDETGRETDAEHATAGADGDDSSYPYQEIGGVKGAPKRRGESVLYAAIPDQDAVMNEYSYSYANPGGNGVASSAAAAAGKRGAGRAFPGRAPSEGGEQEYAAVRDAADSYGMVENQLYIPFKE